MIPFFRKIRKKMADDNKPMKYMRYAIGEILLVVIGILIALQVNNWNEINKDAKEEKVILSSFNEEFFLKKDKIEKVRIEYGALVNSTEILMSLIGKPSAELQKKNIDSLLSSSISISNYLPTEYVISDVLSSGKLSLLTSESFRKLLFRWTQEIKQKENSYSMLYQYFMEQLIPYLNKHTSLKNIDMYSIGWDSASKMENKTLEMFNELEFENHLDNHYFNLTEYNKSLIKLAELVDGILFEVENYNK